MGALFGSEKQGVLHYKQDLLIHVHTDASEYICTDIHTYICLYVCVYVCMYVRMYVCMHVCMCVYACMYARMYVCMYVCMYVRMHLCMYVLCIYMYVHDIYALNLQPSRSDIWSCASKRTVHLITTNNPYRLKAPQPAQRPSTEGSKAVQRETYLVT